MTYTLGHFPGIPWGNELLAGPLEALLALCFSLVMFLSMTGGADDLRRDIPEERRGRYCLLMQLLYAARWPWSIPAICSPPTSLLRLPP